MIMELYKLEYFIAHCDVWRELGCNL